MAFDNKIRVCFHLKLHDIFIIKIQIILEFEYLMNFTSKVCYNLIVIRNTITYNSNLKAIEILNNY